MPLRAENDNTGTDYTMNKHFSKIYRMYYAHECLVGMKEETQYIFRNGKIPIPPSELLFHLLNNRIACP